MRTRFSWCLVLATTVCLAAPHRGYADGKPAAVKVVVDTAEVPELATWGAKAKTLVEKWHPLITDLLSSDGFTPPAEVKLVFRKDMRGVAGTAGSTIYIAARWVNKHPEDLGMVVHELTHVIQSYPQYDPPWLVEGIADYVRFFHYEPKTRLPAIDRARASYRDGYKTTAGFLAWIEQKYDKRIVGKLNRALRQSRYKERLFKDSTARDLNQLWAEFLEATKNQ